MISKKVKLEKKSDTNFLGSYNGGVIEVRNVNVYYDTNHAVKDITMDIREKSVTAYIGPSGCGKTTLLRVFNRMNDEIAGCRTEGSIILNNVNILDKKVDPVALRRKVGMVFQKPNPFPKSIYDNIAYGPKIHGVTNKDRLDEIVEKSLKRAVLWDEIEDRLHESAMSLSGGQQQRVAVGRAVVSWPRFS